MLSDTNPSVRIEAVKRILQARVNGKKMEYDISVYQKYILMRHIIIISFYMLMIGSNQF